MKKKVMSMSKQIILMKKNDYCNFKNIESSSNDLANYNASYKKDIDDINSKSSEFCSDNDITNKADTNKVMDENPCEIHQKNKESKSREVSYSSEDFSSLLRDISRKTMNRMKIGQLSINSIRNKFDQLVPAVVRNLDILIIKETKIDSSFPEAQFEIDGFTTPHRNDTDCHGGGILLYMMQDHLSCLSTLKYLTIWKELLLN